MTSETAASTQVPGQGALTWSRVTHALIALVVLAAFCIQLVLVFAGGADANSGEDVGHLSLGTRLVRLFSYFTIESNLIVLVVATLLALRPLRDGRVWRIARLDALLGIVITGLVFAIIWRRRSISPALVSSPRSASTTSRPGRPSPPGCCSARGGA